MTADSHSNSSKSSTENETNRSAVHRLVAESVQEAHSHTSDENIGAARYGKPVSAEKSAMGQVYGPVLAASLRVADSTLHGTMKAARSVANGGKHALRAAGSLGSFSTRGLVALSDREQVMALLADAEAEGRWLIEGLAGLAGYGRTNS